MMADASSTPPPKFPMAATFTTTERDERAARGRRMRLTGKELQDLRDLWAGIGMRFVVSSPQRALENKLLLAPPRNLAGVILEELERLEALAGGWVSEGTLLRIVSEGTAKRPPRGVASELRHALKRLVRDELVERRPVAMPNVPPRTRVNPKTNETEPCRTNAEQLQLEDWTGFEVRRAQTETRTALALVPVTREERWRRQDESLERELHTLHGSETARAGSYEIPEDARGSGADRAQRALFKMSERDAEILRVFFGREHTNEDDAIDAVRSLVGGDHDAAREAVDRACRAYREARGS